MSTSPTIVLTHWELRLSEDDLALLLLDVKGSENNLISSAVWEELAVVMDKIESLPQVKGLVLTSGKAADFCGGEDLREFLTIEDSSQAEVLARRGQDLFNRLEALSFPTVAALKGCVVGVGLELALACTLRVAAEDELTQFQLPQVRLGFCPAFGATVRLPQLIGLAPAGQMIFSGEKVGSVRAYDLGLVDLLSPPQKLFDESLQLLRKILRDDVASLHEPRIELSRQDYLAENSGLYRRYWRTQFLSRYVAEMSGYDRPVKETYGALVEGWTKQEGPALETAAKTFSELIVAPETAALIDQSFETKRARERKWSHSEAPAIKRVGILGGGRLGGELAWSLSRNKIPVWVKDVEDEAVLQALKTASEIYEDQIEQEILRSDEALVGMARITTELSYDGFKRLDLVVENVVEDFAIKKHVLMEVEKIIPPEAFILSNTASLSIERLGGFLERPERFGGMQFFLPMAKRSLVEVIKGEATSEKTVAAMMALAKRLGKVPVVVKDSPGFVVNRVMLAAVNEALILLRGGVDLQRIDSVAEGFGFALGPFRTADEMGFETVLRIDEELRAAFCDRPIPPPILKQLLDEGLEGRKGREGFYLYEEDRIFSNESLVRKVIGKRGTKTKVSDEAIVDRLLLAMINEACAILEERVVEHPRDVDTALILGAGFAPFRGGLLHEAEARGLSNILERFSSLEEETGRSMEPHSLLREMVQHNARFFGG